MTRWWRQLKVEITFYFVQVRTTDFFFIEKLILIRFLYTVKKSWLQLIYNLGMTFTPLSTYANNFTEMAANCLFFLNLMILFYVHIIGAVEILWNGIYIYIYVCVCVCVCFLFLFLIFFLLFFFLFVFLPYDSKSFSINKRNINSIQWSNLKQQTLIHQLNGQLFLIEIFP